VCGRFVKHSSLNLIEKTFNIDSIEAETAASYNIAPTQPVQAVVQNGGNVLVRFNWGLVPFWAKDPSIGSRMINARVETVADKPSFRHAFRKRRCLIVGDGFYEWKGEKGRKQPWFITLPSGGPFGFAGLWETWKKSEDHTPYRSCTILTADASQLLRPIHHRMPVILQPKGWNAWLDPSNQSVTRLQQILQEKHCREFNYYAVSTRVNHVANNDESCIAPLKENVDENNPQT